MTDDTRRPINLFGRLSEEQVIAVGAALEQTCATEGWRYFEQMVTAAMADSAKEVVASMRGRRDPSDIIYESGRAAGIMDALEPLLEGVAEIVKRASELAETKTSAAAHRGREYPQDGGSLAL